MGTREKPRLEIKVRNSGDEVAFITRVDLTIMNAINSTFSGGQVVSSATYDVELPPSLSTFPTTIAYPVSHQVPAGDPDQIELSLGVPARSAGYVHHYWLAVTLIYNETKTNASAEVSLDINGRNPAATP